MKATDNRMKTACLVIVEHGFISLLGYGPLWESGESCGIILLKNSIR